MFRFYYLGNQSTSLILVIIIDFLDDFVVVLFIEVTDATILKVYYFLDVERSDVEYTCMLSSTQLNFSPQHEKKAGNNIKDSPDLNKFLKRFLRNLVSLVHLHSDPTKSSPLPSQQFLERNRNIGKMEK